RLGHASRENQNVSEWIDIYGPRPQRLLRQRYRVVIGVVVARQRSPRSGVDGVAGYPQIMDERSGKAWPLYCRSVRRGLLFRRCGLSSFKILNAEPLVALRRLAAPAARALGVTERQSHLEREVCAQKIRKVVTARSNDEPHRVFAKAEMVEQEIAECTSQCLMEP